MESLSLVKKLRDNFLVKPAAYSKGKRSHYKLSNMYIKDTSMGQAAEIAKIIDYTVIRAITIITLFGFFRTKKYIYL